MVEVELHVSDIEKAIDFYTALGFAVARRGSSWAVLRLGDGTLRLQDDAYIRGHDHYFTDHLSRAPRGVGVEICAEVTEDVDAVAARMQARGAIVKEVKDREWGARDFRVADPDGYFIRVTTPLRR